MRRDCQATNPKRTQIHKFIRGNRSTKYADSRAAPQRRAPSSARISFLQRAVTYSWPHALRPQPTNTNFQGIPQTRRLSGQRTSKRRVFRARSHFPAGNLVLYALRPSPWRHE
jgi:hypothetical protein